MIIRRKHTANFTTIGNVLFEDERLEADEVGILAYLLSRPDNWEVRRPALMRRWRVGRDSIKRIVLSLIRCGWIVARKTRLSNGTFLVIYEVRDEPGPELTVDEARAATSLVSSDAGPGEPADEEGPEESGPDEGEKSGTDPPTENPSWSADFQPSTTGLPATAGQHRQTRRGPLKEESINPDSTKTESPKRARAFDDVKALWPTQNLASAFVCEKMHAEIPDELQEAAFNGVKPYLADCKANNRKVCDLATYYRERRWERFAVKSTRTGKPYAAVPGTPQWYRWRDYYKETGGPWVFMESQGKSGWDFSVASEWPPALPAKPLATEADLKEFADTS